jgi:hypothetical protein
MKYLAAALRAADITAMGKPFPILNSSAWLARPHLGNL